VNWVVCIPSLVSYAHIVFSQPEFKPVMSDLVKIYFLSSAVIQFVFVWRSSIVFAVGQIQDVGLIFLAAMVRNLVQWSRAADVSMPELVATALWQCLTSTLIVGVSLILIGRLRLSQYVQMLPLPVVGGYLGYIGYFCLSAGLAIGSGKEVSGPETLVLLADPALAAKLAQLALMTGAMVAVHFKAKHFLAMPAVLLLLPVLFFGAAAALGMSPDDCRAAGWLPPAQGEVTTGFGAVWLYDPASVSWTTLPKQFLSVIGLVIVVSFGSSLDISAIQAEMEGQKIDYNQELVTIGISNLASGLVGGGTGSYIFSQTIFSAKRHVQSRLNGLVVAVGELLLFVLPLDILQFLPNSYIGGTMCLFGVDIMNDWLVQSRGKMTRAEFLLVWITFAVTMFLTSFETFGVIEGMAAGTICASFVFAIQYMNAMDNWQVIPGSSSVVRPPKERRLLSKLSDSVLALSLSSFAFFGGSLRMSVEIEAEVEGRRPRFVCIDFARLVGMDSTASDQMRLLLLALEHLGSRVILSSIRSQDTRELLEARGVLDPQKDRRLFGTLDQALQWCEEQLLAERLDATRRRSTSEVPLETLLLDYVDGFARRREAQEAAREAAAAVAGSFERIQLREGAALCRHGDPVDEIFVVAAGSLRVSRHSKVFRELTDNRLASPTSPASPGTSAHDSPGSAVLVLESDDDYCIEADSADMLPAGDDSRVLGVGAIFNNAAYFTRQRCPSDAVAMPGGCVVHRIRRATLEELEATAPRAVVFLQTVLLRDLTQLQLQFLAPLQAVSGLH